MTDEEQHPLYRQLRDARREQGITQSALARDVGCKQSAISMYEAGRPRAIADSTILKIARKLGIDLGELPESGAEAGLGSQLILKFCPTDDCPMNLPYMIREDLLLRPRMVETLQDTVSVCRWCREILEDRCPNTDCGVPLRQGSVCPRCGTPYITVTRSFTDVEHKRAWVSERQAEIESLWRHSSLERWIDVLNQTNTVRNDDAVAADDQNEAGV